MEPLPKERSDIQVTADVLADEEERRNGAAPEGAERPRRSAFARRPRSCRNGAAPEGAERPAPSRSPRSPEPRRNGAAPEGAERRIRALPVMSDQFTPQWSRSRRSGATAVRSASMVSAFAGRNGAAPEGAERPVRPVRPRQHARSLAAMEPLPKERSDDAMIPKPGARPRHGPQWSRSRRSGATASRSLRRTGRTRRNGAAPEGAERQPQYVIVDPSASSLPQWSRSRRSGAT